LGVPAMLFQTERPHTMHADQLCAIGVLPLWWRTALRVCTLAPSAVDGVVLDMLSKGLGCEGLYCVVSCAKRGCWWLPCAVLLLEV
jgi:hypothetical protein